MAPTDIYRRLSSYVKGTEKVKPPMLSAGAAAALSIVYTLLYVLPFYVSSTTRPSPTISRDSPSVIRARIRFVTTSVTICSAFTAYILSTRAHATNWEILHQLGWYPVNPLDILRSLLLTAILFAGPLFEKGIAESGWRRWVKGRDLYETLSSWIGWRNYVAGPVTEEILFRSLLVTLHLLIIPVLSPLTLILAVPLYFGIAHVHHFYEFTLTQPLEPILPELARPLVQFAYTTIFGWYATFLFLRTGSLWTVVLVHAFCNWLQLPRIWGRVGGATIEGGIVGGPVRGKEDADRNRRAYHDPRRLSIGWTIAYYLTLVGGVVAFLKELWPLTESSGALMIV